MLSAEHVFDAGGDLRVIRQSRRRSEDALRAQQVHHPGDLGRVTLGLVDHTQHVFEPKADVRITVLGPVHGPVIKVPVVHDVNLEFARLCLQSSIADFPVANVARFDETVRMGFLLGRGRGSPVPVVTEHHGGPGIPETLHPRGTDMPTDLSLQPFGKIAVLGVDAAVADECAHALGVAGRDDRAGRLLSADVGNLSHPLVHAEQTPGDDRFVLLFAFAEQDRHAAAVRALLDTLEQRIDHVRLYRTGQHERRTEQERCNELQLFDGVGACRRQTGHGQTECQRQAGAHSRKMIPPCIGRLNVQVAGHRPEDRDEHPQPVAERDIGAQVRGRYGGGAGRGDVREFMQPVRRGHAGAE